jgi:hypothetical protein
MRSRTGRKWTCARASLLLLAASAFLLPSCEWDGQFTVLGYTTQPNYDPNIKTVHVPIFKNLTYYKGLEFELTQAVVREIEWKTPYKVVSSGSADTELTGTIISLNKNILNRNQLNEVREAETALAVEVVWRDLRTGEVLSRPAPRSAAGPAPVIPSIPPTTGLPGDQQLPTIALPTPGALPPPPPPANGPPGVPVPPPPPPPTLVQSVATFIPELGESITTARKANVDRLAVQIVSMMEKPW